MVMFTFALKECCLFLLCATVVSAATRAHVGLLYFVQILMEGIFCDVLIVLSPILYQ